MSAIGIDEEEINPHNEISGMDESHAICESMISTQSLLKLPELKSRILKMLPSVVEHQNVCKSKSKSCNLNSVLLQYFLQREFIEEK